MDDFQKLIDFENLYNSYRVSLKGRGKKKSAVRFNVLALEYLCVMKRQLKNHTYKISPYSEFVIKEPKERIVKSGSFKDKVLQHCLCDYVLLPKLRDEFILDNYAGQIGKGTLFGLDRLSENLLSFYSEHGSNGYILKCDITKFFYQIEHGKMKELIAELFPDEEIQWVCNLFIDSVDGKGLPLGNQSSQVFALIYLNGLDHFITETLGCKYYGRYMDDFYLLSDDKDYLKDCLSRISEYLAELGLTLNNKTEIVSMSKGIRFLGFHTYITENGKIIRKINGDNKRKIKKRLRIYAKLVKDGRLKREKFDEMFRSWKNHASHGNCFKLIEEMELYVDELFGEVKKELRIIVAGGRDFSDYKHLEKTLDAFLENRSDYKPVIVSGCARGADSLGEEYARVKLIRCDKFPARWDLYGAAAGYRRNIEMLDYITKKDDRSDGDCAVIAFWDGKSKGTAHMIKSAKKRNIPVQIVSYKN